MPERIPIKAAREVAKGYSCRQVIVLAWDGELTHIVTYGDSTEDCAQAAAGGNMLKQKWGWPECNDQPSRAKKLEKELATEREARERAEADRDKLAGDLAKTAEWYRRMESAEGALREAQEKCICAGNWRELVIETEPKLCQIFQDEDGRQFKLFGVVYGGDDFYYGMYSKIHGLRLLSCVGSLETHGYRALAALKSSQEEGKL